MKVGGGGGEVSFLSSFLSSPPLLALLLAPFFAPSLTLVLRSLFLNRTETLAAQANLLLLRIFSAHIFCVSCAQAMIFLFSFLLSYQVSKSVSNFIS